MNLRVPDERDGQDEWSRADDGRVRELLRPRSIERPEGNEYREENSGEDAGDDQVRDNDNGCKESKHLSRRAFT